MLFALSAIIINSFLSFFCFFAEATPTPHIPQPPTIVPRQELAFADISIGSVNYVPAGGPGGCSGVTVTFAPGTYKIEIHYSSFGAWSDPSNPDAAASSCHVTWVVNHPADWAVGLNSDNTVSGSVYLPALSNHTAYLSDDLSIGGKSLSYYTSWPGPLEWTDFTNPSFPSSPVDFSGCPTTTQTKFSLSTYLEVERQPIYASIWLYSQTLSLQWDPCPPA